VKLTTQRTNRNTVGTSSHTVAVQNGIPKTELWPQKYREYPVNKPEEPPCLITQMSDKHGK